ncbi:hypothetical protein ABIB90_007662 [Bradyrhizobium sp. JR4.1]
MTMLSGRSTVPLTCFLFWAAGRASLLCWKSSVTWPALFRCGGFDREMTILGLNPAASILRCSLMARDSKKPIVLRLAQFAQFEAARLINMRGLIDTFDLVEQALGRSIHLPNTSGCVTEAR